MLITKDLGQSIQVAGLRFVLDSFIQKNAPVTEIFALTTSYELSKITTHIQVNGKILKLCK